MLAVYSRIYDTHNGAMIGFDSETRIGLDASEFGSKIIGGGIRLERNQYRTLVQAWHCA